MLNTELHFNKILWGFWEGMKNGENIFCLLQNYLQWPRQGSSLSVHGWMDGWINNMGYYSTIRKRNPTMCSNKGGLWGLYAKWNKSTKDKYCMILIICEISKKHNRKQKENATHRYREQIGGCQRWVLEGGGRNGWRKSKVQKSWGSGMQHSACS